MKWLTEVPRPWNDKLALEYEADQDLPAMNVLRLRFCAAAGVAAAVLVCSIPWWWMEVQVFVVNHWVWLVALPVAWIAGSLASESVTKRSEWLLWAAVALASLATCLEVDGIWSVADAYGAVAPPLIPLWLASVAGAIGMASSVAIRRIEANAILSVTLNWFLLLTGVVVAGLLIWRGLTATISVDEIRWIRGGLSAHWPPIATVAVFVALAARVRSKAWSQELLAYDDDPDNPGYAHAAFGAYPAPVNAAQAGWSARLVGFMSRAGISAIDILLSLAAAALFASTVLYYLPGVLVDSSVLSAEESVRARTEERRTLLAVLAALGAGVTLLYTHLRHQLDQDSNNTGRYSEAVQQLGHESLSTRLGGIYALGRVARDSQRDSNTIVEVLAAYVLESTAPRSQAFGTPTDVAADALAALKVLSRTPGDSQPPDLRGLSLNGSTLSGLRFRAGSYVDEGNFQGAHLTKPHFAGTSLQKANLRDAQLDAGTLANADLTEADLTNARLVGCDLSGCWFTRAQLHGATLTGSNLAGASFEGADLRGADLQHVEGLNRASLGGARWDSQTLLPPDFDQANLDGSKYEVVKQPRT